MKLENLVNILALFDLRLIFHPVNAGMPLCYSFTASECMVLEHTE